MDPLTGFAVAKTVAGVATGISGFSAGRDEAARLEGQARLAETQALQRDTEAREELTRFISTVRASRAANGLSAFSPNARVLTGEAAKASDRDRLRQRADDRQRAANFRAAAKSARRKGAFSLITGSASGGGSLFQGIKNAG